MKFLSYLCVLVFGFLSATLSFAEFLGDDLGANTDPYAATLQMNSMNGDPSCPCSRSAVHNLDTKSEQGLGVLVLDETAPSAKATLK